MNEEMLLKYMRFTDKDVLIDKKFYETYLIPSFANAIRYKRLYEQSEQRINKVNQIIDECLMLMPHEFSWEEQIENIRKILGGKE